MEATELAPDALVSQYLHVVNRALGQNRDEFPYDKLLEASEKLFDEKRAAVGVYKDDPRNPHHWFTVEFSDGKFSLVEQGKGDADLKWELRQAHLEEVVENPDPFIESPIKLDLDWLKKSVGIGA